MTITALPPAPNRASPSDFSTKADAFLAALALFVTEANALAVAMNLNDTISTSVTSLAIGVGSKSLTVDLAKSYQPGMSVKIAYTTDPTNWMHGDVTSYNADTGALVVNVTNILGSGTQAAWTVTLSAPGGAIFATAAEILTGTETAKAIAPDQFVSSNVRKLLTTEGDLLFASAANVLARLAKGTARQILGMNNAGTFPNYMTFPKFSAHKNGVNQSNIPSGTPTKVTFPTEVYDVGSAYDAVNSRWIPGIVGEVHIGAGILWMAAVDQTQLNLSVYLTGILFKEDIKFSSGIDNQGHSVGFDVPIDAVTDYIEIFVTQVSGSDKDIYGIINKSWFMGHFLP